MDAKNPIQSAERIFQILEYIAKTGSSGVVEIGNALDLHKSTVHRMLHSLVCMGYAIHNEKTGKYELTFKLVKLSSRILSNIDIYSIIHPYMEQLANICQETVHLVKRTGCEVVYIDKVEPIVLRDSSIRMASRIGLMRPMYCSGVGKAILAMLPMEDVQEIWGQSIPEKKTKFTIISFKELEKELINIKKNGYALDNQENEIGVRCIAAAITDYQNSPKYAFSISAPINRMTDEKIEKFAKHVLQVQKELSQRLGS
jgi:DNA-binding IclR family transcriptional regulator